MPSVSGRGGKEREQIMEWINWHGKDIKVMQVIEDEKYGTVWYAFLDHRKVYIVNDEIAIDSEVIDYLDDHHGRPVRERGIVF